MAVAHLKYKVAAVQAAPAFLDLEGSVEKTIRLIRRNWPLPLQCLWWRDEAAPGGAGFVDAVAPAKTPS